MYNCSLQPGMGVLFEAVDADTQVENMSKLETLATRMASPQVMSVPQLAAYKSFVEKITSKNVFRLWPQEAPVLLASGVKSGKEKNACVHSHPASTDGFR